MICILSPALQYMKMVAVSMGRHPITAYITQFFPLFISVSAEAQLQGLFSDLFWPREVRQTCVEGVMAL